VPKIILQNYCFKYFALCKFEWQPTQLKSFFPTQKIGWSSAKVTNRKFVILVNVLSHIDVTREWNRIDIKKEKVCKDFRKLEVTLAKAKYSEAGSGVVEAKISASHAEPQRTTSVFKFILKF